MTKIEDIQIVKCSYCGEEMDCPKEMLWAGEHVCSFCMEVMEEGMSKEEIKNASKRERMLSKYKSDVNEMADTIFFFAHPKARPHRKVLGKMNKKEIEENAFYAGVLSTLHFILHTAGPEALTTIRDAPRFRFFHITDEELEKEVEKFRKEGIDVDLSRMETFEGELKTAEGIAKMINYVIFKGDWEKQLEWEEKHGHPEDVELVKKIVSKMEE
ncbi:MAG: hypothetical protein U9O96_07240 [Candidatus Thermoplasmatota archaeon]|nr:hypothetical protein [Candidatus Thermoplasmatota archaeon]